MNIKKCFEYKYKNMLQLVALAELVPTAIFPVFCIRHQEWKPIQKIRTVFR